MPFYRGMSDGVVVFADLCDMEAFSFVFIPIASNFSCSSSYNFRYSLIESSDTVLRLEIYSSVMAISFSLTCDVISRAETALSRRISSAFFSASESRCAASVSASATMRSASTFAFKIIFPSFSLISRYFRSSKVLLSFDF